jgi:hypothetical protein
MSSSLVIESKKVNINELAHKFETIDLGNKIIIKPIPVRQITINNCAESNLADYYDTENNVLDIDSLVYDFASYIEIQLGFRMSQDTCSESSDF